MSLIQDKIVSSLAPYREITGLDEPYVIKLVKMVHERMEEEGDVIWMREASSGKGITLGETIRQSFRFASWLIDHEVNGGDVVALVSDNSVAYFPLVVGVWRAGAVVSLSDPLLEPTVLARQFTLAGAVVVVCSDNAIDSVVEAVKIQGASTLVRDVVIEGAKEGYVSLKQLEIQEEQSIRDLPQLVWDRTSTHTILWSSGTTGDPKGIEYDGKICELLLGYSNSSSNIRLQTTCMFHMGGFFSPLALLPSKGSLLVFFSSLNPSPEDIYRAIDKYKPQSITMGSHHGARLAASTVAAGLDVSSVKTITPAGAALGLDAESRLLSLFPSLSSVVDMLGMTEIGIIARSRRQGGGMEIVPGVKVKIRDVVNGQLVGPRQVGEIMAFQSGWKMKGYLNMPFETAAFWDKDGFAYTGDCGYYDEEGKLYFVGRHKTLIKVDNKHLYPREVEFVLEQMPGVLEAAVYGVPDQASQELVKALVVKREGEEVSEEEVLEFANSRLAPHKRITGGVTAVQQIRRNPQGKVIRKHSF